MHMYKEGDPPTPNLLALTFSPPSHFLTTPRKITEKVSSVRLCTPLYGVDIGTLPAPHALIHQDPCSLTHACAAPIQAMPTLMARRGG